MANIYKKIYKDSDTCALCEKFKYKAQFIVFDEANLPLKRARRIVFCLSCWKDILRAHFGD